MTAPPPRPNPADVRRRRAFASTHIADATRLGPIPTYGSAAWHRLPYPDPRRWAAVLVAAEAWAHDGDDIPGRLRRELADQAAAEADLLVDDELAAEAGFAAMARDIRRKANQVPYAVLQHRRGELTDDQLAEWEQAHREWLAGLRDRPAQVPPAGVA